MKKITLLLACTAAMLFACTRSYAQFSLSVNVHVNTAPPPLPVYTQPPCPVDGYLWSPGYWAWDDEDGYYWVPGVWIMPPQPGYLWTPGYWGFSGGYYGWHGGYWATHVGFYGGVDYGYGYGGSGFYGGRWEGGHYRYNTAVVQVNQTVVHNTYVDRTVIHNTVINNTTVNRVSYNGGAGTTAKPSPGEQQAMHDTHVRPTAAQITHNQTAASDLNQFAQVNKGRPQTVAMDKPGGGRFDQQGKNAPPPVTRQPGNIRGNDVNKNIQQPDNHALSGTKQHLPGTPDNQPSNPVNTRPVDKPARNTTPDNNSPAVVHNNHPAPPDNGNGHARRNNNDPNMHPPSNQGAQQHLNQQQHTTPIPRQQSITPRPQNNPPMRQPVHPPNPAPRNNPPPRNEHAEPGHHR